MKAAERTKKRLVESLITLMSIKTFDKITIEEITENAYLTRTTFYNYFTDKYDVVNYYYQQILEKTILQIGKTYSWEEATKKHFEVLKEQRDFIKNAFQIESINSIFSEEYRLSIKLYNDLYEKYYEKEADENMSFLIRFYCLGSLKTTTQWINRDMTESPEFMTELLKDAMPEKMKQFVL